MSAAGRNLYQWWCLGLITLLAAPALAQDAVGLDEDSADARWIPALSIFTSGAFQGREATSQFEDRAPLDDDSLAALWSLGLSAEVSTPVWRFLPGRPRLFVHGDLVAIFDPEEPVVNDGDPGAPRVLTQRPGGGGLAPVAGVQGRGSAVRVQAEPVAASAGVGLAFSIDLGERALRLKPSIEWSWQEDRILGVLGEAESEGINPDFCGPCRTLFISEAKKRGFHSLGAGLEAELDAARVAEFVLTVYTGVRAYHVLGDRDVSFDSVGTWMVDGVPSTVRPDSVLTSSYEREPWHYQIGAGVRLRWLPL